jgi:cation-transporting ATPase E
VDDDARLRLGGPAGGAEAAPSPRFWYGLLLMSTLQTDAPPLTGLSTAEADRRRAAGQGNDVEIKAGRTYGRIVRDNVFNFINNLFYFLGILLLILGKPLDAFAVVFVIAANTVISLFQEIRAKRVMDKMAILLRPKADVLRDGELVELDPSQVVLGDILRLEPGDQVVVDGPMVGDGRMEVDESLLTGESDLVTKHPGDELMSGSFCMTGGGYYEAEHVGLDSFANKLTAKAKVFKRELTPLQRQVVQIVRVLLIVVVVFETLVWVRNVLVDVPFVESVRMSTVILALIPNGLVLSIALTYALGAVRLLGKDVLVQQFNAIESLSNVDVLCTDKTGTLTSGVVTFEELVPLDTGESGDGNAGVSDDGSGEKAHERAARVLGAFAASTTDANRTIEALRTALPAERLTAAHEAFFSSERKWSGLAFEGDGTPGTYVLGAPEVLAPALGAGAEEAWRAQADEWAARGLRVVLFCGRDDAVAFSPDPDAPPVLPSGLRALALISFSDELREGVHETLEGFSEAGIDVKVISGDNPKTVVALAKQAGMQSLRRAEGVDSYCDMMSDAAHTSAPEHAPMPDDLTAPLPRELVAVSGAELAKLEPDAFAEKADEAAIFGRVTPEQKQDLVQALRGRGRYVAMIGDGVNDVIALKQANVAVAMQGGSQAARSVGDLILMKDTFAPLPYAFTEGQRIINGMNDILRIFMVRIFFKAAMILIVTFIGGFPFAPRQSALLSFFGATVPAIAFALWAQPGPTPKVGLFKLLARFVLPAVVFMTAIGTAIYVVWSEVAVRVVVSDAGQTEKELLATGHPQAMTALTVFACFAAIFLILLIVPPSPWWAGGAPVVRNDRRMVGVVAFLFLCMLVVLSVPLARTLFEITALPWWQYLVLLAIAFAWSQLCLLVWKTRLLDRWLGTAEDPGNVCAKAAAAAQAEAAAQAQLAAAEPSAADARH